MEYAVYRERVIDRIPWRSHLLYDLCVMLALLMLFMAALCNRAGHVYFHPVVCCSSFFSRLISAIADWMSTILPHMVWP